MNYWERLAKVLVHHSCKVKVGEKVLIEYSGCPAEFVVVLMDEIMNAGGYVYLWNVDHTIQHKLLEKGNEEQWRWIASIDKSIMASVDAVILIGGEHNSFWCSDIGVEAKQQYATLYSGPVHIETRLKKKWVLLRYPTDAFAQSSQMSTGAFEEYFYKVCCYDYDDMAKRLEGLENLMRKTDRVRIVGDGTDLSFSIKDMGVVKCCGDCNIPDGEIYTAPIRESVEGVIRFNVPVTHQGVQFGWIELHFEKGKVVKSITNQNQIDLDHILDTDEGSRYLGEFAFGVHPCVTFPINDILFDEKMYGSIHLALGNSYADADNGNRSALHWDLILDQRNGGEIYFDDVLIRKNGEFILYELVVLNRENMLK